jgi:NAD(P)H dehydrogenase (quinone)
MKVAIVYDSGYGHTKVVAEKISEGFVSQGVDSKLFFVRDLNDDATKLDELEKYDAIIFGSPTYMGSVSADFKKFMDLTSGVWYQQKWKDKISAGFTNSAGLSGDKFNTLATLVTFACQHSMVWVSQGIFPNGELNRLGSWTGLMVQSENAPAEQTPPENDRKYAFEFGVRIAKFMLTKLK